MDQIVEEPKQSVSIYTNAHTQTHTHTDTHTPLASLELLWIRTWLPEESPLEFTNTKPVLKAGY